MEISSVIHNGSIYVVYGQMKLKFELIQAFMRVYITCKYQKDLIINNREKVETPFPPLRGVFLDVQGQNNP